jgi:predicted deacylase
MMKVIGMLDGDITKHDKYTIVNNAVFFFNQEGGLFVPDVKVGTFLKKNERIGHIINFHGETVDEVLNPWENGWIAAIRHNYVPTDSGELVAESYEFEKEESYED